MGMENVFGKIRINIMGTGKTGELQEKVSILGLMAEFMRATGKIIRSMGRVS